MITTIIGEFARLEYLKEGMDAGGLINMLLKFFVCFFLFFFMCVELVLWVILFCVMWVPQGLFWGLQYIMCAINGLLNLPNCFLWYVAEIMGTIIYLPFRITFYLLDLILGSFGFPFKIQEKIVDPLWWFLDDISHLMYDEFGISHFVHFPDEIIKKCYTCKVPPMPPIPDFFPMGSVTSAIACIS